MMKTVAIRIKRLFAALLVLSLCFNSLLVTGITVDSHAAEESMELLTSSAKLEQADAAVLSYDTVTKSGWIGGNGTTASTGLLARYFTYDTFENVMVGGEAVALTSCEVTYSVTFSEFAYDTATYPYGVRQQGVILMLRYNDGSKTWLLENRFGNTMYGSGHYMQIDGTNSTLLANNAGAPFYSESVNNSVVKFPSLTPNDVISLKVKCANGSKNGYIKLLLNGEEKHSFVYTGTKLPDFGLKSCKLMAKISDISLIVDGATGWATSSCSCENPEYDVQVTQPTCGKPGYTTYTCKGCGISYTADEVAPLDHTYEDGTCTVCGAKEWDTDGDGVLEILALGNSFSVDALEYVWQIANNLGIEKIVLGNLYIGGCSLQTHATNAAGNIGNYTYYYNDSGKWISSDSQKISTTLESRSWDYVSLQQQSGHSGLADTYNESLSYLVNYIKERSDAKLIWHMTWAYQQDSTHASFANYNNDQMTMYNAIVLATQSKISTNSNFALIVPNGTAVQNSRTTPLGDTTTRDGYHMSTDYGRYLTGLMFFKAVTGLLIDDITYAPAGVNGLEKSYAIESVNNAYAKPFAVTQSTVEHTAGEAVKENETAATCKTPACYDMVVYCTDCSVEISRETVVTAPALGHKFVNGVCSVCGKNEGVDLMSSATFEGKEGILSYDVNRGQGWIGGNGTTASNDLLAQYFTYDTSGNVMVGDEAVALTSCEVTYSVTFSEFAYDTATYPSGVRQQGVILMLRYNDGSKTWILENRFGNTMYGSGHYMQIGGTSSTLLENNAGAPFYSESVKNSVAKFPSLVPNDVISLKVKCANGSENGYIKLLLNGEEMHSFVYTGTKLPDFGLKSCKLMAKISDISLLVNDATAWACCNCEEPAVSQYHSDTSCAVGGVWYGKCENCGNEHTKTMEATDHTPDGQWITDKEATLTEAGSRHQNCLVCGEVAQTEEIPCLAGNVDSWNLTLSDDLAVNFRLNINEAIVDTAKIVVAVDGDIREYPVASLTAQDDGTYMVTVHVAAAQMNDTITVQIANGESVGLTKKYTVAQYAKAILEINSYSAYHTLVKEMLNYGNAAQTYFEYNVDNRTDVNLEGVGTTEIPANTAPDMAVSGDVDGISFYGASLLFRNKIAVRYYFTVTGDVNSYKFTVNGTEYEPVLKDNLYYIEVADINPQDLDDSITVMVNDTLSVSYSPMNYIVRMSTKGSENLKALMKALYNYHLAAEDHAVQIDPDLKIQDKISVTDGMFIHTYGRMDKEDDVLWLEYTATGFSVNFVGKKLDISYELEESYPENFTPYVTVVVDDESYEEAAYYACPKSGIISVETDDGYHTVRVYKRSEGQRSRIKITGVYTDGDFVENREYSERLIEFFGDSITAGYGNRSTGSGFYTKDQDGLATYAFLAAQELDAEVSVVAASGKAINMNIWKADLKIPDLLNYTTFTNTAPYVPERIPQVVVINGGANDAPYINQATDSTDRKAREDAFVEAYAQFIQAIAEKYEGTTILCCTNMIGEGRVIEPLIQEAISRAAVENVHLLTLPSYQEDGVVGADGHPTVVTHQKAANVLEEKIREIMGW